MDVFSCLCTCVQLHSPMQPCGGQLDLGISFLIWSHLLLPGWLLGIWGLAVSTFQHWTSRKGIHPATGLSVGSRDGGNVDPSPQPTKCPFVPAVPTRKRNILGSFWRPKPGPLNGVRFCGLSCVIYVKNHLSPWYSWHVVAHAEARLSFAEHRAWIFQQWDA